MLKKLSREPVRLYLYSVATAVLALLATYGVVTADRLPIITGVVVTLLAIPTTERLRNKVTPMSTLPEVPVIAPSAEASAEAPAEVEDPPVEYAETVSQEVLDA